MDYVDVCQANFDSQDPFLIKKICNPKIPFLSCSVRTECFTKQLCCHLQWTRQWCNLWTSTGLQGEKQKSRDCATPPSNTFRSCSAANEWAGTHSIQGIRAHFRPYLKQILTVYRICSYLGTGHLAINWTKGINSQFVASPLNVISVKRANLAAMARLQEVARSHCDQRLFIESLFSTLNVSS